VLFLAYTLTGKTHLLKMGPNVLLMEMLNPVYPSLSVWPVTDV